MIKKEIIDGKLECSKCKTWYPATSEYFYKSKIYSTGLSSQCKICINKHQKEYYNNNKEKIITRVRKYYQKNPDRAKNQKLKKAHGITLEVFNLLLQLQKNKCLICLRYIDKKNGCVDHNHKTGKIRGILCSQCNFGLGNFKDNIKYLQRAIKYLKRD